MEERHNPTDMDALTHAASLRTWGQTLCRDNPVLGTRIIIVARMLEAAFNDTVWRAMVDQFGYEKQQRIEQLEAWNAERIERDFANNDRRGRSI